MSMNLSSNNAGMPLPYGAYGGYDMEAGMPSPQFGGHSWKNMSQAAKAVASHTSEAAEGAAKAVANSTTHAAEGAAATLLKDMKEAEKLTTYGIAEIKKREKRQLRGSLLCALLLVPWIVFILTYSLMSFHLRYSSSGIAHILAYSLVLPTFAFVGLAIASRQDAFVAIAIALSCFVAWSAGCTAGDYNFQTLMKSHYDLNQLNTYPHVNPTNFSGAQVMDAGSIGFAGGAQIMLPYSMAFKSGDVYCVAPIGIPETSVKGKGAKGKVQQKVFDFWAVGKNCCGHHNNFQCGEFSNPMAHWGVRVMQENDRNMYQVAVKQAAASYNLEAPHPLFVHWTSDDKVEKHAYGDNGVRNFIVSIFLCLGLEIFVFAAVVIGGMYV